MNLKLSGVGAEPKKLAVLGFFLLVAVYFYFSNRTPGDSGASSTAPARAPVPVAVTPKPGTKPASRLQGRQRGGQSDFGEFRPSLKPKKDANTDRASIDPTLRLDLLQRLRSVKFEGTSRSLFESGASAVPPPTLIAAAKRVPNIIVARVGTTGPQPPPPPPPKPAEPPPPPIPLKFYGFVSPRSAGVKRAFFLDGDDIIVATEGQTIKNRYKIVRIGLNSAVVEDTQFKNHQQTLPLIEELPG